MGFGGSFEKKGFDALPKGRYSAVMHDCTLEESKQKKTPYLQCVFVINDQGDYDGRKIWHKMFFTEGSYDIVAQQLENVWVFDKLKEVDSIDEFKEQVADVVFQLVNKTFEVAVTGHDEYNGKSYPKTFITGFKDAPNLAIQTEPTLPAGAPTGPDDSEEIPF